MYFAEILFEIAVSITMGPWLMLETLSVLIFDLRIKKKYLPVGVPCGLIGPCPLIAVDVTCKGLTCVNPPEVKLEATVLAFVLIIC